MRVINVGKPGYDGTNDGDGSTVAEAATLQALAGTDRSEGYPYPCFREFWKLDHEDLAVISDGGLVMLTLWTPQMPVHAMQVHKF